MSVLEIANPLDRANVGYAAVRHSALLRGSPRHEYFAARQYLGGQVNDGFDTAARALGLIGDEVLLLFEPRLGDERLNQPRLDFGA